MKIQLSSLLVLLSLGALAGADEPNPVPEKPTPAKIELRTAEVSVPMHWFGKRPVVEVKINAKGPYRFFLDTGAQGSVLDQGLADELKLPVVGKARVGSPGGKGLPANQVRLDRVEVGDAVLSGVPAVAFDRSFLDLGKDTPQGVLSASTFPGFLVTLDYPESRLVIRRGQLPAPDGACVFAYDAKRPLPEIRLSVAGQDVTVHLDSGSGGGIALPLKLAGGLPLASKPVEVGRGKRVDQEVVILRANLNGQVKLGQYVLENPDLYFLDIAHAPGNVGYEFLRRFAVTLDASNHRIQLEQSPESGKEAPEKTRRYGIRLRGLDQEPLEVLGVDAGSPAEKAGLQKGDVILRVNDTSAKSLTPEQRERALRDSPLKLQVQRGRQTVDLRLALGTADTKEDAAKKDLEQLQGEWVMVSSERDGKKLSEEEIATFRRTIKGNKYKVTFEAENAVHELHGTITLDPTKKPKAIDAIRSEGESKGKPMLGIYEFDGKTQKVCFAPVGKERPAEFSSKAGTQHVLTVWKRVDRQNRNVR